MRTTKTVTEEIVVTAEIRCNKCGELCTTPHQEEHIGDSDRRRDWYGLIEASFTTGYFSQALPDDMLYTFSLCEPCVKELMDTFKISAEGNGYL